MHKTLVYGLVAAICIILNSGYTLNVTGSWNWIRYTLILSLKWLVLLLCTLKPYFVPEVTAGTKEAREITHCTRLIAVPQIFRALLKSAVSKHHGSIFIKQM